MEFYVILTVDLSKRFNPEEFQPFPEWNLTQTELNHPGELMFGEDSYHSKWYGVISKKQFDELVDEFSLILEDVETLGSYTVDLGLLPAYSFRAEKYVEDSPRLEAYVTPFFTKENDVSEKHMKWVNSAIKTVYSDHRVIYRLTGDKCEFDYRTNEWKVVAAV